jgi:hypothetical protein
MRLPESLERILTSIVLAVSHDASDQFAALANEVDTIPSTTEPEEFILGLVRANLDSIPTMVDALDGAVWLRITTLNAMAQQGLFG